MPRGSFCLLALFLLMSACSRKADQGTPAPEVLGSVGEFQLTERDGSTVTQQTLEGKVWIASFVFTRCTGPCPQVTAAMSRLQQELNLDQQADLRLVTFTVDPDRDQPDELKRYAETFRAHPSRWLFLTGKEETIHRLLQQNFHVGVARKPADKQIPGDEFEHSTRLVLVDRQGKIRGYFSGVAASSAAVDAEDHEKNLSKLRDTVRALLTEKS